MNDVVLYLLIALGGIGIALLFEESRDWLMEQGEYVFTFEWARDLWEFITDGFEGLGEFSFYGIAFGFLTLILIYLLREKTLDPFLVTMGGGERIMWMIITYVGVFVGGYLMGKMFENAG